MTGSDFARIARRARWRTFVVGAVLLLCLATTAAGQGVPYLVKDLGAAVDDQYPTMSRFTDVDGTLFFLLLELAGGSALWKSDGTVEGTVPVTEPSVDFTPGVSSGA